MEESANFKKLLKLLRINANKFSKITGINTSICYEVANGNRNFSRESLNAIVNCYPNVSLDWLLRDIGEPFTSLPETTVSEKEYSVYTDWDDVTTDTHIRTCIAANLRTMCDRWRLTQQELYELLSGQEVSRGVANKLVNGSTSPSMSMLVRMSDMTGVALFDIMSRELSMSEIAEEPLRERRDVPGVPANELADLFSDLDKLQKRIARILAKYEKNDMDN